MTLPVEAVYLHHKMTLVVVVSEHQTKIQAVVEAEFQTLETFQLVEYSHQTIHQLFVAGRINYLAEVAEPQTLIPLVVGVELLQIMNLCFVLADRTMNLAVGLVVELRTMTLFVEVVVLFERRTIHLVVVVAVRITIRPVVEFVQKEILPAVEVDQKIEQLLVLQTRILAVVEVAVLQIKNRLGQAVLQKEILLVAEVVWLQKENPQVFALQTSK